MTYQVTIFVVDSRFCTLSYSTRVLTRGVEIACMQQDLDDREAVLHRLRKSMRESQRSLRDKDNALNSKIAEHQKALQENQRYICQPVAVPLTWVILHISGA